MSIDGIPLVEFNPVSGDVPEQLHRFVTSYPGGLVRVADIGIGAEAVFALTDAACRDVLENKQKAYSSALAMGGPLRNFNPPEVMAELPGFCRDENVTGVIDQDEPAHVGYRRTVLRAFRKPFMDGLNPEIHAMADEMAAALPHHEVVDVVQAYTTPFVRRSTGRAFGLDGEDLAYVVEMSQAFKDIASPVAAVTGGAETKLDAAHKLRGYEDWAVPWIESQRGTGNITDVYAHGDAERDIEPLGVNNTLYALLAHFVAGTTTTIDTLGSAIDASLRNRAIWSRLSTDPAPDYAYAEAVVQETLRYAAPHRGLVRITAQPAVLAGYELDAGTLVVPMLQAAGHDPACYSDPGRFDPDRAAAGHLGFGGGRHRCAGAPLGTANAAAALAALAAHAPGTTLTDPSEPAPIRPEMFFHGPAALPVILAA